MRDPHIFEGTIITGDYVFHYTCNAPSEEVLEKYNIILKGHELGMEKREILLIPHKVYEQFGYVVRPEDITITSENLLRKLD